MKTIKSIRTVTGTKKIEMADDNFTLIQIREVLKDHRDTLISRLISDLATYVGYTFNTFVSKDQLEVIKIRLQELKASNVSVSKYKSLIEEIQQKDHVHIKSTVFYSEINETIQAELQPSQLPLVS
jgi:hypothetical protein